MTCGFKKNTRLDNGNKNDDLDSNLGNRENGGFMH